MTRRGAANPERYHVAMHNLLFSESFHEQWSAVGAAASFRKVPQHVFRQLTEHVVSFQAAQALVRAFC
jgi:hypothetical protein